MKKRFPLLGFLLIHHLLIAQGHLSSEGSAQIHIGHCLFYVPEGWKTARQGDIFSMTAPDLGPEELLSFLLLPPLTDTGFQNAANSTISQLAAGMKGEAVMQNYADHSLYFELHSGRCLKGWDYSMGTGNIRIPYQNANDPYVSHIDFIIGIFLAKINGRMERAAYISRNYKCGIYSTSTAYKWTYDQVISDFFFDLQFDDWTETHTRTGKITNRGVSGVWTGVAYIAGKYQAAFFALFDNGQAYYSADWPRRGLFDINTISEAANNPFNWGTYTWQDGAGVMKISWQTIPFTISDGKLTAGLNGSQRPFERMAPMDDLRLDGAWCAYNGAACIRFTADGRFEDNGVICRAEHRPTTCNEALPQQGQGTYVIRDHSILFHYSTGLTTRAAMAGLGLQKGDPSPEKLFLGWQDDVLQKK